LQRLAVAPEFGLDKPQFSYMFNYQHQSSDESGREDVVSDKEGALGKKAPLLALVLVSQPPTHRGGKVRTALTSLG
jgi:hypothetical protein